MNPSRYVLAFLLAQSAQVRWGIEQIQVDRDESVKRSRIKLEAANHSRSSIPGIAFAVIDRGEESDFIVRLWVEMAWENMQESSKLRFASFAIMRPKRAKSSSICGLCLAR
jgi:hypothetical protein